MVRNSSGDAYTAVASSSPGSSLGGNIDHHPDEILAEKC
jgi:hypothetical protein